MTEFTPGPWMRIDTPDYAEIHAQLTPSSQAVALVANPDDANLIAAAPELLKAAQVAAAVIDDFIGSQDECDEAVAVLIQLHGAIAKATGAQQVNHE